MDAPATAAHGQPGGELLPAALATAIARLELALATPTLRQLHGHSNSDRVRADEPQASDTRGEALQGTAFGAPLAQATEGWRDGERRGASARALVESALAALTAAARNRDSTSDASEAGQAAALALLSSLRLQLTAASSSAAQTRTDDRGPAASSYQSLLQQNSVLSNRLLLQRKNAIQVVARLRPQQAHEVQRDTAAAKQYMGCPQLVVETMSETELAVFERTRKVWRPFAFDSILPASAQQADLFDQASPLIEATLQGYNACMLAYGITGSGKTHSMLGTAQDPGLIPLTIHRLHEAAAHRSSAAIAGASVKQGVGIGMRVALFEIYNDEIRDLLSMSGGPVAVRQPSELTTVEVTSADESLSVFAQGLLSRATASTNIHAHSSRSHCVLRVEVGIPAALTGAPAARPAMQQSTPDTVWDWDKPLGMVSKLYMVDLAGSERVDKSAVTGQRMKEAQHINRSLSALGDVLEALDKKSAHVPYRNSTLTQVLADSLGGAARTLLIATVSPGAYTSEETMFTLKFAARARHIDLGSAQRSLQFRGAVETARQAVLKAEEADRKSSEAEARCEASERLAASLQQRLDAQSSTSEATIASLRQQLADSSQALQQRIKSLEQALEEAQAHEVAAQNECMSTMKEMQVLAQKLAVSESERGSAEARAISLTQQLDNARIALTDAKSELSWMRKTGSRPMNLHSPAALEGGLSAHAHGVMSLTSTSTFAAQAGQQPHHTTALVQSAWSPGSLTEGVDRSPAAARTLHRSSVSPSLVAASDMLGVGQPASTTSVLHGQVLNGARSDAVALLHSPTAGSPRVAAQGFDASSSAAAVGAQMGCSSGGGAPGGPGSWPTGLFISLPGGPAGSPLTVQGLKQRERRILRQRDVQVEVQERDPVLRAERARSAIARLQRQRSRGGGQEGASQGSGNATGLELSTARQGAASVVSPRSSSVPPGALLGQMSSAGKLTGAPMGSLTTGSGSASGSPRAADGAGRVPLSWPGYASQLAPLLLAPLRPGTPGEPGSLQSFDAVILPSPSAFRRGTEAGQWDQAVSTAVQTETLEEEKAPAPAPGPAPLPAPVPAPTPVRVSIETQTDAEPVKDAASPALPPPATPPASSYSAPVSGSAPAEVQADSPAAAGPASTSADNGVLEPMKRALARARWHLLRTYVPDVAAASWAGYDFWCNPQPQGAEGSEEVLTSAADMMKSAAAAGGKDEGTPKKAQPAAAAALADPKLVDAAGVEASRPTRRRSSAARGGLAGLVEAVSRSPSKESGRDPEAAAAPAGAAKVTAEPSQAPVVPSHPVPVEASPPIAHIPVSASVLAAQSVPTYPRTSALVGPAFVEGAVKASSSIAATGSGSAAPTGTSALANTQLKLDDI